MCSLSRQLAKELLSVLKSKLKFRSVAYEMLFKMNLDCLVIKPFKEANVCFLYPEESVLLSHRCFDLKVLRFIIGEGEICFFF